MNAAVMLILTWFSGQPAPHLEMNPMVMAPGKCMTIVKDFEANALGRRKDGRVAIRQEARCQVLDEAEMMLLWGSLNSTPLFAKKPQN